MAPTRATSVNPRVLVWAREQAGLTTAEVASRIHKSVETLEAWERGELHPTFGQLEQLSESVYKRPVALFFLPNPPEETPIQREFRLLPDAELERLGADTRFALRDARAFQLSLRELTGGRNRADRRIFEDIKATSRSDPTRLARQVREYLAISLEEQGTWRTPRTAMAKWRDQVESVGIFVFKRSFEEDEVSGFCVADETFPLIVVNNSTPFTRQVFTLIHELGHVLFGVSSITSEDAMFADRLTTPGRNIEIACNRFAAEVLVPSDTFPWAQFAPRYTDDFVATMATQYAVSREVILRRLLDRNLIDQESYSSRVGAWASQAEGRSEGGGGGNYYATQASYLGRAFLNLAFSQYRAGNVDLSELAEHLRVKARNIGKLEDFLLQHG